MSEFRMPSLGADMDEGVLVEWLVRPGSVVHKGDVIAVVDTSKAAVEVECFDEGVVGQLLVEPGTRVPVGEVLATIATAPAGHRPIPPPRAPVPEAAPPPATVSAAAPHTRTPAGRPVVTSPLVRRLAAVRQVDLRSLRGTGPGGRITHADVERAAAGAPAAPRARVSPLARRLARELGVDLAAVTGTGRDGAIEADDVRRAAPAGAVPARTAPPAVAEVEPAQGDAAARAAAMRGPSRRSWRGQPARSRTIT